MNQQEQTKQSDQSLRFFIVRECLVSKAQNRLILLMRQSIYAIVLRRIRMMDRLSRYISDLTGLYTQRIKTQIPIEVIKLHRIY